MASFANQTSNISALTSKFDRLLKIRNRGDLRSEEEKQKSADVFFSSQRNRVEKIEKDLLTATGNVLPPSKEAKTITELAELCRLTQVATREKIEFLRSCLENEGYAVTSPRTTRQRTESTNEFSEKSSPSLNRAINRVRSPAAPNSIFGVGDAKKVGSAPSVPLVTTIGGPLESVLEAEYETDGMTTPGSYLQSPMFASTPRHPPGFADDKIQGSGASATPSPARKEQLPNRRTSSSLSLRSPGTPTLDGLRISDTTSKLLQHIEENEETMEVAARDRSSINTVSFSNVTPNRSEVKDQQQQDDLFEFRDEDDMITLNTTMTKNTTFCSPNICGAMSTEKRASVEERSQFFARMEGILERVEETILEESPSPRSYDQSISVHSEEHRRSFSLFHQGQNEDKPRHNSISSSSVKDRTLSRSHRYSHKSLYENESSTNQTKDDDGSSRMTFSRDSTNVVATQIAEKIASNDETIPRLMTDRNNSENQRSPNTRQRPTHILIDSRSASPAHTNITMDATFLNDVNGTSFIRGEENNETTQIVREVPNYYEDDNLSTVTPVLDRYRLDPSDDNSVGVKVVPNKRSTHRSKEKQTPTVGQGRLPTIAQLSPSLDDIVHARTPKNGPIESDFTSPQNSSLERNMRMRKIYRKTPFPKRKSVNMDENEDENHHPNITAASSSSFSPQPLYRHQEAFSITVPPLRHSSFEPKRSHAPTDRAERHSLPAKTRSSISSALFSETSHQSYYEEETDTTRKIDETIERIDQELSSPTRRKTTNTVDPITKIESQYSSAFFVDEITETEFRRAPRIVQTSVNRERANKALHDINKCSSGSTSHFEFTEEEGRNIIGCSEQESRSILISLCHFRRLAMRKDVNNAMIFAIADEMKTFDNIVR